MKFSIFTIAAAVRLAIIAALFAMVWLIVSTLAESTAYAESGERAEPVHRPSACAPYYNDGTDRWKDCMGVGYR